MNMFLKLQGTMIMGHAYRSYGEYTVPINSTRLVNDIGDYIYKYVDGKLVQLTQKEITEHQFYRLKKLRRYRKRRDALLLATDRMCNDLACGERTDAAAVKAYRKSLFDSTDLYKDQDGNITAAIDSVDVDNVPIGTVTPEKV